nr:E3 ubiquitin-protein ligase CHFR-like [Anolis sagrei ordinatus]
MGAESPQSSINDADVCKPQAAELKASSCCPDVWDYDSTILKHGCDLYLPGNKLVSGDHCKIIVDEESGQVSLEDTSSNGTVINKQKLVKKQVCPLQTGDVIYVVYRKNEPENNVAYLYESLYPRQDRANDPVEPNVESMCHVTKDTSRTGQSDDKTSVALSVPASQANNDDEPQPSTSTSNLFNAASTSLTESVATVLENPSTSCKGLAFLGCSFLDLVFCQP